MNKTQRNIREFIHFLELTPVERRTLLRKFTTKPLLFKVIKKQSVAKLTGFEDGLLRFSFFSIHGEKETKLLLTKAHKLLQKTNDNVYRKIKRNIKNARIDKILNSPEYLAKAAAQKIKIEQRLAAKEVKEREQRKIILVKGKHLSRGRKRKRISKPVNTDLRYSHEKLGYAALQKRMRDSMPD